jgi:hypothetical protein
MKKFILIVLALVGAAVIVGALTQKRSSGKSFSQLATDAQSTVSSQLSKVRSRGADAAAEASETVESAAETVTEAASEALSA